ncbi:MAG: hypothetical protein IJW05_12195 [Lentisphaeria bacterium]|nr:hypothetical protein [Lentisphaeria bacterium]
MIGQSIVKKLQDEYSSGKTHSEIAEIYHVSPQLIQRILSDPSTINGTKLKTLIAMFPNATLHLNGSDVDISIIRNLEATVANIRKIVNDDTFTPDKKLKLIQIILE